MISKRTKYNTMDPKRISNYNKFLCTLDQTILNNTLKKDGVDVKDITKVKKDGVDEKDVKDEVDKIIDIINKTFNISNYSSPNFTGQTLNDTCCINNIDPNYYKDVNQPKLFYIIPTKPTKPTIEIKPTKPTIEKQSINIEIEINNISDILKLIDTYPDDKETKYNINMKILHKIKEPLTDLNNMIGMKNLKENIVDQILFYIQNLHKQPDKNKTTMDFMHTVIYGPPGTGKTEIAKIMGQIFSKIGILKKGTFKKVTRTDLIAGYLGQTAIKTTDVIKECLGGVLFIDEAYALGNSEKRDSFSKECIDTLCEALSDHKDNLMVLVAGYETDLNECFFSSNQGLNSRFTWRFKTDNYSAEDLYNIFIKKVKNAGWDFLEREKEKDSINVKWFEKNKSSFVFYGRDIETLFAKIKIAHSRRVFCLDEEFKKKITLKDMDKGLEIFLKNDTNDNAKKATIQKVISSMYI